MLTKNKIRDEVDKIFLEKNFPENLLSFFLLIMFPKISSDTFDYEEEEIEYISAELRFTRLQGEAIVKKFCKALGIPISLATLRKAVKQRAQDQKPSPIYDDEFMRVVISAYDLHNEEKIFREYNDSALDPEILICRFEEGMSEAEKDVVRTKRNLFKKFGKTDAYELKVFLRRLFKNWLEDGYLDPPRTYAKVLKKDPVNFWRTKRRAAAAKADAQEAFAKDPMFQRPEEDDAATFDSLGYAYV